jgi:ribonuclease HIII
MPEKQLTLYTTPLTKDQAEKLRALLERDQFQFEPKPYTIYFAKKEKLNAAVYEKGPKLVLQGKGTEEFVRFHLEPEILGEAKLGYEEINNPAMFEAHFGIDESGKGDFFGPLVIAGVYVDRGIVRNFIEAGIQDSKRIGSDAKIRSLAKIIKSTQGAVHSVVEVSPVKYNELYQKIGNLNRLLAWGHARVIENLVTLRPGCPRALSDQFANPRLIQNALMKQGKTIQLEQRTKAESDLAVAAASILARERFIDWMENAGRRFQMVMPRGASKLVKTVASQLVLKHSPEILLEVAKIHFKTASEIAPERFPPKPDLFGENQS